MSKYLSYFILSLILFLVPLFVFGQEKDQLVKIDLNEKISQILSQLFDLKEMLAAISSSSSSSFKKLRYSFSSKAGNIDIYPVGGNCGSRCYFYPAGTQVALYANPNQGYYFVRWDGDCRSFGSSDACYLTMDRDRRAGAVFARKPKLVVQVTRGGRVTGDGIDCPGDCEEFFEPNTYVTLEAQPFAGFRFRKWSGACSGTSSTCTINITTRDRGVKAEFTSTTGGGGGRGGGSVNKKLLVMMVNFRDATLNANLHNIRNIFFDDTLSLRNYLKEISYNKLLLGGDVVGPFTLNYNAQCLLTRSLKDEIKSMARNAGVAVDSYDMFAYIAASNYFCQPRADHIYHELVLFPESIIYGGLAHEFIHALGNPRESALLNCYDNNQNKVPISNNCGYSDYGDIFDVLDSQSFYVHPNVFLKLVFGWMPSANVRIVNITNTPQQYRIYSSEKPRNNVQALLVPKNYYSPHMFEKEYIDGYYYLEYQRITPFNESGPILSHNYDGLFIRLAPPYSNFFNSKFKQPYLLDAVPNDPSTFSLPVGQTFYDPIANISITVVDRTEDYITVQIGSSSSNNYTLSVYKSGLGSGRVTSSPSGINCGSDCSESYNSGTTVTLTATPDSGSTFVGWSGDCSGTGSCTLTMNSNKSVTANFDAAPSASGTLYCSSSTSNSITLGYSYNNGSSVSLFRGSTKLTTFGSGNGSGSYTNTGLSSNTSYTYYLRNGTSSYSPLLAQTTCTTSGTTQYTLTVQKSGGNGSVVSDIPGIDCGSDCTENYDSGTVVTLMAIPDSGYGHSHWSSNCQTNPYYPYICTVTMDYNKRVTAYFMR